MSKMFPKSPLIRLSTEAYAKLRAKVLDRDAWKCQACGSIAGLEVHHIQRKSQCGDDCEDNLIALCANCHTAMHGDMPQGIF